MSEVGVAEGPVMVLVGASRYVGGPGDGEDEDL